MVFYGISKVFSTENQQQYETIGAFWDELSAEYGRENLQGLGYNWTDNSIEYVMGFKDGTIPGCNCEVSLPDEGWIEVSGKTDFLGEMYDEIYKNGNLDYEIETFNDDGTCKVKYWRA